MSDFDEQKQEELIEHIIHRFMKEQLFNLQDDSKEHNNSFVYLEKSTLNLLITYMLLGEQRRSGGGVEKEFEERVLAQLNLLIEGNKRAFEDILNLLKDIS